MNNISVSRNIFKVTVLVLFIIGSASCGSKKTGVISGGKLTEKSSKELIRDVLDKELKYNTISGKMDIEFISAGTKKTVKSGSYVKLIRDNILQISVRPFLGVEVLRMTLTPDSIYIVDRYNKKTAVEDINSLKKSSGAYFNFYNLQALLTNSLFYPGEQAVREKDYKSYDINVASDMYVAKTSDSSGILYNFAVDATDRISSTLIFSPGNNYTIQWSYKDFIKDDNNVYPTTMEANVGIKKGRFDLIISYSKLDINKQFEVDNSIPGKYEKVSVGDLIKGYMKIK